MCLIKCQNLIFGQNFFNHIIFIEIDRINAGTKDLFTECAKIDDQELKKDIQSGIDDPLVDITSFEDQSLDENYGTGPSKSDKTSGNIVHQSMIKRFNQHSIMVLKASTAKQSTQSVQPQLNGSTPSASKTTLSNQLDEQPKNKKVNLQYACCIYSQSNALGIRFTCFFTSSLEYKKN